MKTVNLTISCRRDYMAVFPVDDKQYKALKNRIKKDGEVNVDENVSAAFIGEMKNDGFESDEEDDYTISNYLTNNLERIKIESVGYDMEDGQQVLVIYYGGFSENGTLNFDFEIEDNEE